MADNLTPQEIIEINRRLNEYYNQQLNSINTLFNKTKERALIEDKIVNNQRTIAQLNSRANELNDDQFNTLRNIQNEQEKLIRKIERSNRLRERSRNIGREINNQLKEGLKYLNESDKTIKSTILNLGLSGAKADMMRTSFEDSAAYAARLGANLSDIATIMTSFADESGYARSLTASMVEDIIKIGNGTGLGIEQAAKLGAQFEYMGFDARSTMDYVQGVVDTSERMGVNTSKVLKNVNDNFKKLSTFTFQNGVKGFADMAMHAEQTRVSMSTALDVAEATRNLDKVIELGANLQVMGGEFAKLDPFDWLYTVRNEPEKLNQKISELTTGMYSFKKNSEGVFEKFITPADRDRLANVAKSLGISNEEMFQIAQRRADLNKMNQDLSGMGLNKREKELIQGAATFDSKAGKFQVKLGETMVNIGDLSRNQIKLLDSERTSLDNRAKQSQTFNEVFKATIEELKTGLLPLLRAVNSTLTTVREFTKPILDWATKGNLAWAKTAGLLLTAAITWKGVTGGFSAGGRTISRTLSRGRISTPRIPSAAPSGGAIAGAGGTSKMLSQLGAGGMALGIGAGVGIAAKGIGDLAKAMSGLDEEQAKTLKTIGVTLAVTFPLAAVGILAAGGAATASAPGLLALGASVLMVGGAVGIAAMGIGKMADGIGNMLEKSKGAGQDMKQVGVGIAAMGAGLSLFTAGSLGLAVFAGTLNRISKHSDDLKNVGNAFRNIKTVMSASKDDFIEIENLVKNLANLNIKGGGVFGELANLLKKPLKVEFANKEVAMVSNITLEIDGDKFFRKTYNPVAAIQKHESLRLGK